MKKVLAIALCLCMAVVLLASCASGEGSSSQSQSSDGSSQSGSGESFDTIPVKMIAPFTGDNSQYGEIMKTAFEIAMDERNEAGGINGAQITIAYYDDKNDPKETVTVANKIISEEDTFAVIGPFSSTCALACGPLFQKAGIVELCPPSSHEDFTKIGDYMFRGSVMQPDLTAQLVDYAIAMGGTKVAILYQSDDVGVSTNELFTEGFEAAGYEVVGSEQFIKGSTKDFAPYITNFKAAGADMLYLYSQYSDAALVINQMHELDFDVPVIAQGNVVTQEMFDICGNENMEGLMVLTDFAPDYDDERYQAWQAEYIERSGNIVNNHAVSTYDCSTFLFDAIEATNSIDPAVLKDWMQNRQDVQGIGGVYDMNGGDPVKTKFPMIAHDGEFIINQEVYNK